MATPVGPITVPPGLPGGISAALDVTAPTVIKSAPGVLASVVCVVAGSATINDTATTAAATTANQIWSGSMVAGQVLVLNWPCGTGITVSAVTTAQLSIAFS